jgi:signal transduction histidine kinase
MAFFRRPARSRPIRLFLISMFAVPLVSLVALWGFAASITVVSAVNDHNYSQGVAIITNGFASLTAGLPQEQAQSYLWLSSNRTTSNASLLAARKLVDKGIPAARDAIAPAQDQLSDQSRTDLNAMFGDLAQLGKIRAQTDSGTMSPLGAFQAYTKIIDDQWQFYFAGIKSNGSSFADVSIGSTDMSYAVEMGTREAVLVGGALIDRGQMNAAARQQFAASVASRRNLTSVGLALLTPDLGGPYASITASPQYLAFQNMEDQISASPLSGPIPVDPAAWQADSGAYLVGMQKAGMADGVKLSQMSASLTDRLITEAVLAGGLGLVAVIASVFLLVWFGRKVTGDLTGLHNSVRGMAEERLPRVVERLRRGEDVDVDAESPPPATSTIREISQIAESFGTVQGAAVAAAVDQASLRKGVNQVFLNISMRNQSLLHRQLGMLDSMERRTAEPGALADLFRLDHLTTRMRRHAEGLIILSGSTPGRGWRHPVPVIDVLRAAVAEVEDYVRVDVTSESRDLVAGGAVNDIIHLVAELVENATVFSPPNTRIEVRAERVGTGLVAEIEDRGLGLSAEELADINRRFASSQEFDLANSNQLGLFVVSQLAGRHDIDVSLRRSAYGGTTAIILIPFGVIVRAEETGRPRAQGSQPADDGAFGGQALPPGMDRSVASATMVESHADGSDEQPSFGLTGRHRLPSAAASGYWTDARTEEQERPHPLSSYPLAPWESRPTAPQAQAPSSPAASAAARAPWAAARAPWDTEATAPWPRAFQSGAPRREPSRPDGPLATDDGQSAGQPFAPQSRPTGEPERSGSASSGSHLGMPIRVPQASLAPQLRPRREAGTQTAAPEVPQVDERSPEATRNMLILMQQGWRRGRVDDLDDPEGALGTGTD